MKNMISAAARVAVACVLVMATIRGVTTASAQIPEWTQRNPSARGEHAMAYDAARGVTVLLGGYTSLNNLSDETWEFGLKPCPADFNHDGYVNGNDYDEFAGLFETGDHGADLNQDGYVNGNDFDAFAEHFEAGC